MALSLVKPFRCGGAAEILFSQGCEDTEEYICLEAFKKFPNLRKQLWAGELWSDGYFVRSLGEKVAADIVRKYIEYQTHEDKSSQLCMFEKLSDAPPGLLGGNSLCPSRSVSIPY